MGAILAKNQDDLILVSLNSYLGYHSGAQLALAIVGVTDCLRFTLFLVVHRQFLIRSSQNVCHYQTVKIWEPTFGPIHCKSMLLLAVSSLVGTNLI